MIRSWLLFALLLIVAWGALPAALRGDEAAPAEFSAEQIEFFEKSVRPVLVERCHQCHAASKQEGELRLDSREAILAGGDSGPAAIPGEPEKSLLIAAIHFADDGPQMPPKGKLDGDKIAALTRWVKLGLPWPQAAPERPPTAPASTTFHIRPADRQFWSLVPVRMPELPPVSDPSWPQTNVDRFILAKLEASGRQPAPPADPRALIRRLSFDLTGLPPTPEEVDAFVLAFSPSPTPPLSHSQQAERESGRGGERGKAIAALVDKLLDSPHYGERMARLWLDVARYGEDQAHTFQARQYPQGFRYRDWVVAAFNRDLPYDDFLRQQIAADLLDGPDKTERLAALGFFACGPVYYGDKNGMDQVADRIDTLTRGMLGLTVACARCHDHKFDPISTVDYYALAGIFASTDYVELPLVSAAEIEASEKTLSEQERKNKNRPKKYPFLHAIADQPTPRNMRVHLRGNAETLGEEAPRRFVEVLAGDSPQPFTRGSGRQELAEAIASPDNPLTPRVLVNRLWQQHFGRGLVRTASNFGILGERPTHPEMLDYLAAKFVASGWSIKALQREIVLSATYQQSAFADEASRETDPENLLVGRMNRRRLEVEAWRDALLAVTGRLDDRIGGPPVDLADANNRRRTLYAKISRHELDPLLRLFDFPDPNITSDQRAVTTVPLQQLFVLNSDFMTAAAQALAGRLQGETADDASRIQRAYELLYSRPASEREVAIGREFLSATDESVETKKVRLTRWERYAQALLAANEFMYVD
ncbi:MAG: PSD1 and planctomycete cytochrome C domain-containing protein [Pirellulaceae bacterium]|nr:PSD1 and planctomycete cytochrome C domain-containing protein [Pirellulaceae bacterium]